jgi:hypothetical protein
VPVPKQVIILPAPQAPAPQPPTPTKKPIALPTDVDILSQQFNKMSVETVYHFETSEETPHPPRDSRTAVVFANTLFPELNHAAFEAVHSLKDIPGTDGKSYFYGFSIMQEIDFRWVADYDEESGEPEPYRCKIISHQGLRNTLEFTMPGPSYTLMHNRNQLEKFKDEYKDAIDDDSHRLAEDLHKENGQATRKYKKILLVFPENVFLNADKVHEHETYDDKNEVFPDSYPHIYTHSKIPGSNGKHFLYWKVARTDLESYKKGRVETRKKVSRLKAGFSSPTGTMTSPAAKGVSPASSSSPAHTAKHPPTFVAMPDAAHSMADGMDFSYDQKRS